MLQSRKGVHQSVKQRSQPSWSLGPSGGKERETINIINKVINVVVKRKSGAGTGIWGAGLGVGLIEKVRCGLMEMRELVMWVTASKVLWRTFLDPQVLGSSSHSLMNTITT